MMGKCSEYLLAEESGLFIIFCECLIDFKFGFWVKAINEIKHFGLLIFDSGVFVAFGIEW